MKAKIITLGCKVNQYETQAMEQELRRRGHELVDFEDSADAYIVNTCSVTAVSDKKSRQMIRRAKRRSPNAVVAACGCYIQTHTDEAKGLGIDLIGGTGGVSDMGYVKEMLREIKAIDPNIMVEQAAGITNGQQVYDFIMAGSEAAGAASGIMNAKDPIAMIDEMIAATRRAADDLKKK